MFQLLPVASCPIAWHYQAEPGSILLMRSFQIHLDIDEVPSQPSLLEAEQMQNLSLSLQGRCSSLLSTCGESTGSAHPQPASYSLLCTSDRKTPTVSKRPLQPMGMSFTELMTKDYHKSSSKFLLWPSQKFFVVISLLGEFVVTFSSASRLFDGFMMSSCSHLPSPRP